MKLSALGVVVWVSAPAHGAPQAVLAELGAIAFGSVLRAAVGMMNAAQWRPAGLYGGAQCGKRRCRIAESDR